MYATPDALQDENTAFAGDTNLLQNQRDVGQYIADMILELRNMAKSAKLYKVMVPLEFAYYESYAVANRVNIPAAELERLKNLAKAAEEFDPPASAAG
jgi:hypothetical protein